VEEVEKVMEMIEIVEYDTEIKIDNIKVTFRDAGHILGSSSIEIFDPTSPRLRGASKGTTIVFSGDLGNTPEDIVRPTTFIEKADFVVMETTYGDKDHPLEDVSAIIQKEINTIEQKGGVLLIPAFSIERTQEILHRIHHLKRDGKIKEDTPVFMDSPMAIRATEIFKAFKQFYNEELRQHKSDPFDFEGLVITPEAKDSKEIIAAHEPKVIIAGSGMMSGGRILHHAANYLSSSSTRLLFVGYQAEETLGREILEGARHVNINRKSIKVSAHIGEVASMSSHADQKKLVTWLEHIQGVKKVFLIHGDTQQRAVFAQKIQGKEVVIPKLGETYKL
nr:MBL fold metallo-hydrolase [Candidatus Levybacteria bacterium]